MLATRNLKRLRFGQTGHGCTFLGLHRIADDERDGWVQEDESKTKSNVGEKVDNHRQYKKAKEKKERNIAHTFKHEDNFHYFLIPRSLAFGAADKREGCHVIFVILFSEPGVNDFKCYLISISFFILAVSFFSALNDVI